MKWWQQLEQRIVVISTNEVVFIIGMVTIYTALANIIDKMNMRWHNFHIFNFSRWTVFVDARHWPPFLITLYACLCTFLLFVFFVVILLVLLFLLFHCRMCLLWWIVHLNELEHWKNWTNTRVDNVLNCKQIA